LHEEAKIEDPEEGDYDAADEGRENGEVGIEFGGDCVSED
jgi:hypothetical protein